MQTTTRLLENYLHAHIPITAAMQVRVVAFEGDSVTLAAPLAPNINHRETVFGGSASTLCILSAWALIHVWMQQLEGTTTRIVIQRNTMEYLKPIQGEFEATCRLNVATEWPRFLRSYQRKGVARLILQSNLTSAGEVVGQFEGAFVAFDLSRSTPEPEEHASG
jgi:thioesterase domain-containing protein